MQKCILNLEDMLFLLVLVTRFCNFIQNPFSLLCYTFEKYQFLSTCYLKLVSPRDHSKTMQTTFWNPLPPSNYQDPGGYFKEYLSVMRRKINAEIWAPISLLVCKVFEQPPKWHNLNNFETVVCILNPSVALQNCLQI